MIHPTSHRLRSLIASLVLILLFAGCGDDDPVTPPAPVWPPADLAASPADLMQRFLSAYEAMDAATLLKLMSADHLTILQPSTTLQFPDVGPSLDMTEEARIHERMFSRRDQTDPSGSPVPAIEAIEFLTFAAAGDWALSAPTDPIPDAQFAPYDVQIRFDRGQTNSLLQVRGVVKFYATPRDTTRDGRTFRYYLLCGQFDLTQSLVEAKDSESSSWGDVKALFR